MERSHASAFDEPSTPVDEEASSLEAPDSQSEKEDDIFNVALDGSEECQVATIDQVEGPNRDRLKPEPAPAEVRPGESVTKETAREATKQQETQSKKMVLESQSPQAFSCKAAVEENIDEDDGRDKSRRQVLKALQNDLDNAVADKVETVCYQLGRGYKSKVRELICNLKANSELRQALHSGSVSAEQLCRMSPEELATRDLADLRDEERRRSLYVLTGLQSVYLTRYSLFLAIDLS